MNGFKWFQGFLGFCGGEKLELSIPGRRAWSGIRGDKGTPCTQSPAGLTRPSSGMWLKLTALSLTGITSATRSCLSQGHPFHVAASDVVMQRPGSLGSFQGIFKGHSSFRVSLRTTWGCRPTWPQPHGRTAAPLPSLPCWLPVSQEGSWTTLL